MGNRNQVVDVREMIVTATPFQLMIKLSLPAILGMVVVGLYSFMDSIFVGQMVGSNAMAAISVSGPLVLLNNGIATLLGVGSASVLSRAIGRNDQETIDKIMGNMVALVVVLSSLTTVGGLLLADPFLRLSGASGEIFDCGSRYLHIVFWGSLFVNFGQSANMIMRGEGVLKQAMLLMGMGALVNIVLDPLLIAWMNRYGKGIEGAAIATVISQIVLAILTLHYFMRRSPKVRIRHIGIHGDIVSEVLAIGATAMLMQLMTMVQHTLMFKTAAFFGGGDWQKLLSAALRIQAFAFIPLWGISQGFQPAAGTNYGAGLYARVRKISGVFMLGATALALVFYIPIQLAPRFMLSLFITESDIVEMGVMDFRIFFSLFFAFGGMIIAMTLFQALGKAALAGGVTILRQILFFIPLVMVLPRLWNLGIHGVWLAPVLADLAVCVLAAGLIGRVFRRELHSRLGVLAP